MCGMILRPAVGEQPQGAVHVLDGQVQVVHVAQGLVGADYVEHHPVGSGCGQPGRELGRDEPAVHDDLHPEFGADPPDVGQMSQQRHPTGASGAAGHE